MNRTIYDGEDFLKRLKEVSGISTLTKLADDLAVAQGTISKFKKAPPSGDLLLKIASRYNCSIDYLLGIDVSPAADRIPTYPDFIKCVDAIVENNIGYLDVRGTGEEDPYMNQYGEIETYENTELVLAIDSCELRWALTEYKDLKKALAIMDSKQFSDSIKRLWLDKELKKKVALNVEGMHQLSALRDFADAESQK